MSARDRGHAGDIGAADEARRLEARDRAPGPIRDWVVSEHPEDIAQAIGIAQAIADAAMVLDALGLLTPPRRDLLTQVAACRIRRHKDMWVDAVTGADVTGRVDRLIRGGLVRVVAATGMPVLTRDGQQALDEALT